MFAQTGSNRLLFCLSFPLHSPVRHQKCTTERIYAYFCNWKWSHEFWRHWHGDIENVVLSSAFLNGMVSLFSTLPQALGCALFHSLLLVFLALMLVSKLDWISELVKEQNPNKTLNKPKSFQNKSRIAGARTSSWGHAPMERTGFAVRETV